MLRQLEPFFDEDRIQYCLQTYEAESVFDAWVRDVKVGEKEDLIGLLSLLINPRDPDLEEFVQSQGIVIRGTDSSWLRIHKLLDALQIQAFLPEVVSLYAVRNDLKEKADRHRALLDQGRRRADQILRVNEGFFYWPECEAILRRVFVFYNAVIYEFLDLDDDLREEIERSLEADSLGSMLRSLIELNSLLEVPDGDPKDATEDEKQANESRRQFRAQFENTFGRATFSGGITNQRLNDYIGMCDEYRNKPAHGHVKEVTREWALKAMESLLEIVKALIDERVYQPVKVAFAFETDAWGRERMLFWEEPYIGRKGDDYHERAHYSEKPEILYRPCMGCEINLSSGMGYRSMPTSQGMYEELSASALEKENLIYGQNKWVFWTLDELDALREQRIDDLDLERAVQQADETLIPHSREDPDAVLAEVESHLRNHFRKRVVDRFFNRGENAQAIKTSKRKVLQSWRQVQERKEYLHRIAELIYLIALRKAKAIPDQSLLKDFRELMREACGNLIPCNQCEIRDVCRWVNSLAADVISGE